MMEALLKFARGVDALSEGVGKATIWVVLVVVLISAGNAISRYALNLSSNAWLEIQWYLFSAIFLLCAAYVLKTNEHIRIDVIAGRLSERAQNWIDVAFLTGKGPNPLAKPTGPSAEEELAEAIKRQHAAEAGSAQAAGPERSRP